MYIQLKQIRFDCHRLLTEYSTKSHSQPLSWQVLLWAGSLITYIYYWQYKQHTGSKTPDFEPKQFSMLVTYLWEQHRLIFTITSLLHHTLVYPSRFDRLHSFRRCMDPKIPFQIDQNHFIQINLPINHQPLWTKHETLIFLLWINRSMLTII